MVHVTSAAPDLFVNQAPVLHICGNIVWSCPGCGKINTDRMNYSTWRIRCTRSNCRRWYVVPELRECPPGYNAYWRSRRPR